MPRKRAPTSEIQNGSSHTLKNWKSLVTSKGIALFALKYVIECLIFAFMQKVLKASKWEDQENMAAATILKI
jgi:hypothetical protein